MTLICFIWYILYNQHYIQRNFPPHNSANLPTSHCEWRHNSPRDVTLSSKKLTFCHWQSDRYLVGIHTLAQRWANVHRCRVLTWLDCVGCITLGQHWTNVCLPLWFWITVCWKYYNGPTLGQCTPVYVLTWLDCVGCITLGQHWTNVCIPLWFWMTACWKYYVDPTLGQCTPVMCFNMTELRWVHYVGPTLDQSMHATLVLDDSLLRILRWSNVGPMYTGDLFKHDRVALGALRWANIGPTYACHFGFG